MNGEDTWAAHGVGRVPVRYDVDNVADDRENIPCGFSLESPLPRKVLILLFFRGTNRGSQNNLSQLGKGISGLRASLWSGL